MDRWGPGEDATVLRCLAEVAATRRGVLRARARECHRARVVLRLVLLAKARLQARERDRYILLAAAWRATDGLVDDREFTAITGHIKAA